MLNNNLAQNQLSVNKTGKPLIKRIVSWGWKHTSRFLPDRVFIPIYYNRSTGERLNLKHPITFNDKVNWIKLNYHNPIYTVFADKYAVRKYVSDRIGENYLKPLLGVWDSFDEIDFSKLPAKFVLKCTHDSSSTTVCKEKKDLDIEALRNKYSKLLKQNYYYSGREWQYKNIKPRILAEEYIEEKSGQLRDYKIFCFDGEPKLIQLDYDKFADSKQKCSLYTPDWQHMQASINYPTDPNIVFERPKPLDMMLDIARTLSKGYPFLRVDLHCVEDIIYFGELTLSPEGGSGKYHPESLSMEMGSWLKLPTRQR